MSSELKPAYVPKIARTMKSADGRGKTFVQFYLTPAGEMTFSPERAAASRDRAKIAALVKDHEGGMVQEWALSDRRINL